MKYIYIMENNPRDSSGYIYQGKLEENESPEDFLKKHEFTEEDNYSYFVSSDDLNIIEL